MSDVTVSDHFDSVEGVAERGADAIGLAAALLGPLARRDAPLGGRTTYRCGGAAALLVEVEDDAMLEMLADVVRASGVALLVVGNGSNLLVGDGGVEALVVALGPHYSDVSIDEATATVRAGGALAFPVLARKCAAAALSGMAWAVGIPGSVGGAVAMNAGGHGASTGDRLVRARIFDLATGTERTVGADGLDLAYRHSNVTSHEIVLEAIFGCEPGERETEEAAIAGIVRWRREHQPGGRNAGSVFTNPPGDSAGRLIEACGLKGRRIGSASVSEKHANFIQLDEDGAADDVIALISAVRAAVFEATGVELSTEVRIVGRRAGGSEGAR